MLGILQWMRACAFSIPVFAFSLTLLGQTPPSAAKPAAAKPAVAKPATTTPKPVVAAKPAAPARPPGTYATIYISHGTVPLGSITFKFYMEESPITSKNFIDLAEGRKEWKDPKSGGARVKKPLFTGLIFHRVIPNFMIQGGDPLGNGTGGTDAIPDEFHPTLKFDQPGRVAMANAGPGTGSSQFFITESNPGYLDGKHTIFGQVVDGQELVNKIARVPVGPGDRPQTPVRMTRVSITRVPVPGAVKPAAPKPATPKPATPKPAATKPAAAKKTV